jgi:hypothetical protein
VVQRFGSAALSSVKSEKQKVSPRKQRFEMSTSVQELTTSSENLDELDLLDFEEIIPAKTAASFRDYLPFLIVFAIIISGLSFMLGQHFALEMALNYEIERMMESVDNLNKKS